MSNVWLLTCYFDDYMSLLTYITFHYWGHEKKDKVQLPPQNEMISLCCTVLGFICKNE